MWPGDDSRYYDRDHNRLVVHRPERLDAWMRDRCNPVLFIAP
jgi:hypothetical protein